MYVVVQFALCPNLMLAVVSGYLNLSHFPFIFYSFKMSVNLFYLLVPWMFVDT